MFAKKNLRPYAGYGLLAAFLYILPVLYFILQDNYQDSYFLYIGNILFAGGIALFLIAFNKPRNENAQTSSMVASGILTSVIGIGIAFLMTSLVLAIDIPHLFRYYGSSGKRLSDAPVSNFKDSTNGLKLMLLMNVVIGNIITGTFVSSIYSFGIKGDQPGQTAGKRDTAVK